MLTELDEMKRDFLREFAELWNRAMAVWADDLARGRPRPTLGDRATYSTPLIAFLLRVQRPEQHGADYSEELQYAAAVVESN